MTTTPRRFEQHRKSKTPIVIPDRVAERAATKYTEDENGCWISTYSTASHGYAQIGWNDGGDRHMVTAHRAAWVHANGQQIPDGMTIDHTCKARRCVNPAHLRAMENFENARRTFGRDWKEGTCINGHPNDLLYQQPNGRWRCPPCDRTAKAKWAANNPDKVKASRRKYNQKKKEQATP